MPRGGNKKKNGPGSFDDSSIFPYYVGNGYYGTGLSYHTSDDPMYDALYQANPYVGQTYKPSWFEKAFGGLFRTGYDKWMNEMQLNAAQYDASVAAMQQQNLYDSPASQAERERQAGINPDLLGTGDVQPSASMQPDVQDAQIPEGVDVSSISNFASMIGACFSGSFALIRQGIDIVGSLSDLRGQDIENTERMQDLALRLIRQRVPAEGFTDDADYMSWLEGLNQLIDPNLRFKDSLAYEVGLKRGDRLAFDDAFRNAIGSLPAELERFKDSNELIDSRVENARKSTSRFYSGSMDVMKGVNQILVEDSDDLQAIIASNKVSKANLEASDIANAQAEANIQGDYLDYAQQHAFGRQKAVIEGEGYNITKIQQAIDKRLKQTRQKILDFLEKEASNGNDFATYMIHNMMLHEYMNFDFKTSIDTGFNSKGTIPFLPSLGLSGEIGVSM